MPMPSQAQHPYFANPRPLHIHKHVRQLSESTICQGTLHPHLCASTLSLLPNPFSATIPTLIAATVRETIVTVQLAAETCASIPNRIPDLDIYHIRAIADCAELLDETIDQLQTTLSELSPESASKHFHHLQTLLSATFTNQYTCLDGLSLNDTKKVRALLAAGLEHSTSLVSNSLALLKQIRPSDKKDSTQASSAEYYRFPSWVSKKDRRLLEEGEVEANLVVAADGSGDYETIQEAVLAAPNKSKDRFVIYVKEGVYEENVEVAKKKWNIMLVGDGMGKTIVTGNRSVVDGWTTFRSATVAVTGLGFLARDLTIENTAGASKHQAVALRVGSDFAALYRCSLMGYQDTLYTHSLRQFYRDCDIYGTIDFIFGDAAVVFQNCNLYARMPNSNQFNAFTAQGRKDPNQNTGISIHRCNLTAAPDLLEFKSSFKTYMGRPWKLYSRTVVMESYLDDLIDPAGWVEWDGDFALESLYYGEYMNTGPAANTSARVTWPGYRVINSSEEANQFMPESFIQGNEWLSSTAIPYESSFS